MRWPPVGPPGGAHPLRRPGVPGAARPALRDPAQSEEAIDESGFDDRPAPGPRRRRGGRRGWPSTPRASWPSRHPHRPRRHRHLGRRHRRRRARWPWPPRTARPPGSTPTRSPRGRRRARRVARRRGRRQGHARRQGPHPGARRPGLARCAGLVSDTALAAYLARPDQRSYDLADLTLRYLKRELARAADVDEDQGELLFDDLGGDAPGRRRRPRCCTPARCSTSPRPSTPRSRSAAAPGCSPTWSCRWSTCWPRWSRPASPSRSRCSRRSSGVRRRRARGGPGRPTTPIGGREVNLGSPKQLQAILFDELGLPKTKRTKTGYTTDADALQSLFEKTEHPFLQALLRHRDQIRLRQTIEGLLKTVATATGASTPPTTRPSRPRGGSPAPTPTCRTSRSAPSRVAASARASWSGRATSR